MARLRTRPTRQETASRLIEGARAVFAEKGFHGARIEDICAHVGLTRGAFYSGFTNKDELFLALYDGMVEEMRALTRDALARMTADGEPSVDALVHHVVSRYPLGREWFLLNAEFTLYAIRNERVRPQFAARRRLLRATVAEVIDTVQRSTGRTLTVDAELFARLLIGIFDAGLGQSLIEPDALGPTTFGETFLPGILTGFSADRATAQ